MDTAVTPDITTYDIVGVGIGPFNLGLAALTQPLVDSGELTAAFFDQREEFRWHPGLMLDEATIQVPFLADLVTLADPTSPYSFLNYLKLSGKIHRFYIRENFYPLRREYSDYCGWVDSRLNTTHWGARVRSAAPAPAALTEATGARWLVDVEGRGTVAARNLVSGVGTRPYVPDGLVEALRHPLAVHSADYLPSRAALAGAESVTVLGSGQSAAEIYADLLPGAVEAGRRVDWLTRSPRFFPMEYTKLTLEMTSPEYAGYFRGLPAALREGLNRENRSLYKGISGETVNAIYDLLYRLDLTTDVERHTTLRAGVEASYSGYDAAAGGHELTVTHLETGTQATHRSEALVVCTGYRADPVPPFLEPAREQLRFDASGRLDVAEDFSVDADASLFVLNNDEHVHSLNAPDLGMGPWRNSIVLRRITGREVYPVERHVAFQDFGGLS